MMGRRIIQAFFTCIDHNLCVRARKIISIIARENYFPLPISTKGNHKIFEKIGRSGPRYRLINGTIKFA